MTETSAPSFTEWLRGRSEPDWTAVTTHPFTDALFEGLVPAAKMRSYLVQDFQFVDDFLALLGSALAKADRYSSRLAIAGSIGVVTSEENTYFQRAFDALGVGESDRTSPALDPATTAFRELMADTNARGGYAEVLTVLTVAEWSYLEWAMRAPAAAPENFVHAEWIELHNNHGFRRWVQWLCGELDRVGAALDERARARCLRLFQQATRCELDFFNAHWD
ncbi:thiaminase/transcriptional activator TenA [Saccharopolyspora erythraea NRRL 2338]|uniref:Aminopyrimidine aminohydrolase n=2 Tax=Saccharopolyspora erythraea TaxID=1836 RepID=A4FQI4_SACEN|nr:TenA family protein [Saccharopolyspora erythraea]EQD86603.1 TenA family transcriptional regulator [Saccharopolyspora erythraea D]PFG92911.1 thiaminase/transcriptional activator TenA [Saccharopolyspora erythraea NRRL 2338]QRK89812.1 TenA family protein [Saccharopolyspora erythraea]CAM06309.1 transcriptional regulator, TenA/THI-4 family protein, putative [Saccharopolyspora erythraea NRRL 2338]